MTIATRIQQVREEIAKACEACGREVSTVELLPVSKRHPHTSVLESRAAGLRVFGENRVQELAEKAELVMDADIEWHLIGSLQTNKVNQLLQVRGFTMLHSLDRIKLADSLQAGLARNERKLGFLLQVDATADSAKHGASLEEAPALLAHVLRACPRLVPAGLMAMGPLHGDPAPVFRRVARLREDLRERSGVDLSILSMGMTGDIRAAIAAGSTMVRVGTGVFGPRPENA